jgi:hypothetical protein
MRRVNPRIAGNTQQREAHLEGHSAGDRLESPIAVREVAGILPEKVADERFGGIFVSGRLQVEVL